MGRITRRSFPTLLRFREARKLSQEQAADLVGITQPHWSRLEDGKAAASPKLAKRMTEVTGVPLEVLLGIATPETGVNAGN